MVSTNYTLNDVLKSYDELYATQARELISNDIENANCYLRDKSFRECELIFEQFFKIAKDDYDLKLLEHLDGSILEQYIRLWINYNNNKKYFWISPLCNFIHRARKVNLHHKLLSNVNIIHQISNGSLGTELDFEVFEIFFRTRSPLEQIKLFFKREVKDWDKLIGSLRNPGALVFLFTLMTDKEFLQLFKFQDERINDTSPFILWTLRYCTDHQLDLIEYFPLNPKDPPRTVVLQYARDMPEARRLRLMQFRGNDNHGSPVENIEKSFSEKEAGHFHPARTIPPYILLIANLKMHEYSMLAPHFSPYQIYYLIKFGKNYDREALLTVYERLSHDNRFHLHEYLKKSPPFEDDSDLSIIKLINSFENTAEKDKHVKTLSKIQESAKNTFNQASAELLQYYAVSNRQQTLNVIRALKALNSFSQVTLLFLAHSNFFIIENLLKHLKGEENRFIIDTFSATLNLESHLLTERFGLSPDQIARKRAAGIPQSVKEASIIYQETAVQVDWLKQANIKTQVRWLDKINKGDVVNELIKEMKGSSFTTFVQELINAGSPSMIFVLQYCSDDQFYRLEFLADSYKIFEFKQNCNQVFEFLLKVPKERRRQLFEAPLLKEGLSASRIISTLNKKFHLYDHDKMKLALIPPLLLVGCYISLKNILKLSQHLSSSQIQFIGFYGRRAAVIQMINYYRENNGHYQVSVLCAGLPKEPVLHPNQLTKSYLQQAKNYTLF